MVRPEVVQGVGLIHSLRAIVTASAGMSMCNALLLHMQQPQSSKCLLYQGNLGICSLRLLACKRATKYG
jgi:hypothetical protein